MNRQRTAKQFLHDIHGNNHINFRLIKDTSMKYNSIYNEGAINHISQLNNQGYNVYFVVNGGGDTDESINKINAVFVDFDCPKENKKHPPQEIVEAFKREQLLKVHKFKFKPSYIIETRNGLHVYWLVNDGATAEQFTTAQHRLIDYFDSDKTIKNLSRVMRLPDYYWTKDMSQKYMVTIKECNLNIYTKEPYRYNIADVIDALPIVVIESKPKLNKRQIRLGGTDSGISFKTSLSVPPKLNTNSNEITTALMNKDIEYLKTSYNLPRKIVSNKAEFNEYIRSIDLRLILGIENVGAFKCIFHDDSSPSAGIFRADDGASLYKCHSASCGVSYNIINVVEKLGKFKTRPEAYKFIEQILNVEIVMTENQIKQVESLEENINFLMFELKNRYPSVYNNVRHQIDYLIKMNQLAKQRVVDFSQYDENGNALFFASLTELCEMAEIESTQKKKIVSKNAVLQYHGLVNKLSDSEIPDDLLEIARTIQNHYGLKKRTNFYSIPSYTTEIIENADEQAHKWKDNSYTVKGASREMFYRKEGLQVANWLYPQHTHITKDGEKLDRTTSSKQDEIHSQIVQVIFNTIEELGYCTEKHILDRANVSKTKAIQYIKVNLPEILDSYNLIRVRANKELKEQFGITGTGSPFLLLKNNQSN